jgi:hypothetical protein
VPAAAAASLAEPHLTHTDGHIKLVVNPVDGEIAKASAKDENNSESPRIHMCQEWRIERPSEASANEAPSAKQPPDNATPAKPLWQYARSQHRDSEYA